jgi:hypothetical protein
LEKNQARANLPIMDRKFFKTFMLVHQLTLVNQRVVGSSPKGERKIKHLGNKLLGAFFVF